MAGSLFTVDVWPIMNALTRALSALALLLLAPTAFASADAFDSGRVQVRLIASVDHAAPGQPITLGLQQRIVPHWHTYWLNPGDSGVATAIEWQVSDGAQVGDIQWPVPQRIVQGPVTNYGYADAVTLLAPLTIPAAAKPGTTFQVKAKARWLVCRDVCIPEHAELTLTMPVLADAAGVDGKDASLIVQARSRLPRSASSPIDVSRTADGLALHVPPQIAQQAGDSNLAFFPAQWGWVDHGAVQAPLRDEHGLALKLKVGDAPPKPGERVKGLLVVLNAQGASQVGYQVDTVLSGPVVQGVHGSPASSSAKTSTEATQGGTTSLSAAWLLALLGGIVLNLMPCVFPVLSIKALSLLQHSEQTPRQARLHGLTYTAGVLLSFAALAAVLIALKAGGEQVGWGFQFQSPLFVLLLAYLMFAVGLSLSGVVTVGASFTGLGSSLAGKEGLAGSFFTGVLATVVATPCTAPFMGGAVGYALSQPPLALLSVFLSLGLGLALPYLALSMWPRLQRLLPRPGIWMERVKQAFAFPMYGATAWLVWVLAQQAGVDAVALALAGLVAIAFAAWVYDSSRTAGPALRRSGLSLAALAVAAALVGGKTAIDLGAASVASSASSDNAAQASMPYSLARFNELRAQGKPVFVNLTAAWCITCLVNERVALSQASVQQAFKDHDVHYLKGDWTKQDPEITRLLEQFGRSGVPLYLYYPAGSSPSARVLPQILTPDIVLSTIQEEAAPQKTASVSNPFTTNR